MAELLILLLAVNVLAFVGFVTLAVTCPATAFQVAIFCAKALR